jgi:hypothetical protein
LAASGRSITRLIAWCALLAQPDAASAQFSATLDGGWATIHYDEYLRSSVFTFSPTLRLEYPRSFVAARGTLSAFESGSRSVDFLLGASTFTAARGPFRLELAGGAGGAVYNGFGTGHLAAGLRLHVLGSRSGAWVGGTGGYVDDGVLASTNGRYSAGAWARLGDFNFTSSATHHRAELVSVTDFEGGVRFSSGMFSAGASAGARAGGDNLTGVKRWGEVSSVFWLSNHLALVGAHGRYPSEPGRGTPGGNYSTVALRIATRSQALDVAVPGMARGSAPVIPRPIVAQFQIREEADSSYVITIRAPGARRLELAGDFTDWQPTEMSRAHNGNNFTLSMKLLPGAHKFTVRVDAGEWGVPPGVPVVSDELAGFVALLIIR